MSRIEELPPDDPSVPAVSNLSLVPRTSAPSSSSSSSSQRQQDASAVLHLLHALTMPVFTISFTMITTTTTTSYAPAPQRREHVGKVIPKKQRALPAAPSAYSPKRKAQLALPAPSSSKEEGEEEREPVEKKQKTQPAPSAFQRLMAPKRETKSSPSSSSPPSSPYVVHCMRGRYDVYIGRPNPRVPRSLSGTSKWGNPFMIPGDGNRAEVIRKYEAWLLEKPELVAQAKSELRGKVLGCWCSPEACHGDVLARIANAV